MPAGLKAMDFTQPDEPDMPPEINTTPLIDVLLVLLVMLIVTIPLPPSALSVALPQPAPAEQTPPPPVVHLRLDADGTSRWNDEILADAPALDGRLAELAASIPRPGLRLHADGAVAYGRVVGVIAAIDRHGLTDFAVVGGARRD